MVYLVQLRGCLQEGREVTLNHMQNKSSQSTEGCPHERKNSGDCIEALQVFKFTLTLELPEIISPGQTQNRHREPGPDYQPSIERGGFQLYLSNVERATSQLSIDNEALLPVE